MNDLFGTGGAGYASGYGEGGSDELQTDVMRFMAILAFCLMAIFAIVQSMPLHGPQPAVDASPPGPALPSPVQTVAQPSAMPPKRTAVAPDPALAQMPALPPDLPPTRTEALAPESAPAPARPAVDVSPPPTTPAPVTREPVPLPRIEVAPAREMTSPKKSLHAPAPPSQQRARTPTRAPVPQQGFMLRFEDDAALLALVAARRVGVYALELDGPTRQAWSLDARDDVLAFVQADAPRQINEMTPQTIPGEVIEAFTRASGRPAGAAQVWGVTLPLVTRREIDRLIAGAGGGELVIDRLAGVSLYQRQ